MSEMNVIEKAIALNIYFEELGGNLTTQDLYQLPLTDLDKMYKILRGKVKESVEDSLLATTTRADRVLQLKVDVVTHIVRYRQDQIAKQEAALALSQKKDILKDLIEQKKLEGLKDMSIEELEAQLNEL